MKDPNFSECKFSGEMVSYMYGELSSDKTSAFERHLLDCSSCTDDFAAISSSRYEVYDWKKLEFDPLETPSFDIPFEVTADLSWAQRLRAAFGSWAMPAVSFAAFAIVSVVGATLIWQSSNDVDLVSRAIAPEPIVAPSKDEAAPAQKDIATGNTAPDVSVASQPNRPAPPKRIAPKSSDSQPVKAARERSPEAKQTTARKEQKSVPMLNEYAEDEEDTSLRLAELLENIGSR